MLALKGNLTKPIHLNLEREYGKFSSPLGRDREFPLSQANFTLIKALAYGGQALNSPIKRKYDLRPPCAGCELRQLNSFDDYCALLQTDDEAEKRGFINSITTNLTSFS